MYLINTYIKENVPINILLGKKEVEVLLYNGHSCLTSIG